MVLHTIGCFTFSFSLSFLLKTILGIYLNYLNSSSCYSKVLLNIQQQVQNRHYYSMNAIPCVTTRATQPVSLKSVKSTISWAGLHSGSPDWFDSESDHVLDFLWSLRLGQVSVKQTHWGRWTCRPFIPTRARCQQLEINAIIVQDKSVWQGS